MSAEYSQFLARKSQSGGLSGFDPIWTPEFLFPFQREIVTWAIRKGRAALFEDCGLGKSPQELVWAENVVRKSNGRVLLLTPIAVGFQMLREAEKFGIEAHRTKGDLYPGINITNYEQLHKFRSEDFAGCVCDESSILKNFDGEYKSQITEFMRKLPYRLLGTATAAPNDYVELGTSSEALGELGYMDMLSRFFKNDQGNTIKSRTYLQKGRNFAQLEEANKWRLKGHAEVPFWRWICSWARAIRKPSDLGLSNDGFILPELIERDHLVEARTQADGMLFSLPAIGLREQREERRRTINERCEKVADLVKHNESVVAWCHLNEEGDLLERLIPDAIQVSGKDSDEAKEEKIAAFTSGQARVLVTKQKIAGWGMNWQHCHHTVVFPSHSFEAYYQSIRRFWRFGQQHPVRVDVVTTEGEKSVLQNLQRKSKAADKMFDALVHHMNDALHVDRSQSFAEKGRVPAWM